MKLAGLSPAGVLIVRAGQPFAMRVRLRNAQGDLQNLTGRSFILSVRFADQTVPLLNIAGNLSSDGMSSDILATEAQARQIYDWSLSAALEYDIAETTSGSAIARWYERIDTLPGSDLPGQTAPLIADIPASEITLDLPVLEITERGATGPSHSFELFYAGDIAEPTLAATKQLYMEAAQPFADAAEVSAGTASEAATLAENAKLQAEAAALTALLGNIYQDYDAGFAATDDGDQWVSYGPEGAYATRYLKTGGAGIAIDAYPSKTVIDLLNALLQDDGAAGFAVCDADGIPYLSSDGEGNLFVRSLRLTDVEIVQDEEGHFEIIDPIDGAVSFTTDPTQTRFLTADEGVELDGLKQAFVPDGLPGFAVCDDDGTPFFGTDEHGNAFAKSIHIDGLHLTDDGQTEIEVLAEEGGMVALSTRDFVRRWELPDTASDDVAQRDAANLALSAAVARQFNTTQQPIMRNAVDLFVAYGQSLGRGQECWPVLSKTPRNDGGVYMLGLSTRPWTQTGTSFDPLYGTDPLNARLHPMVAVVNVNNTLPSDATIAAYVPGTNVPGEGPEVGAINFLRAAYLDHHGVEADPATPWAVISCGVGGQSIEALSKPASNVADSYYNRVLDGIAKVMSQPEFAGMDVRVPAILWLQGEEDYENGAASENPSIADYKSALRQLRTDLNADIAALTGQTKPPAFVTYQTSGFNTEDFGNLFVGEAQLEAATQDTGLHMAAATYPLTDKTVHLDPNGSRWLGMQFGKVLSRLLLRKEGWMPLHPRRATISGTEVLIDFHVPEPPLRWALPFEQLVATDYANKGFVVRDAQGDIPLSSVEIAGQTMVRLTLSRPAVGAVRVEGGTKRGSSGNLCLQDSDATIATENYEYAPGTGQYAAANIAALVGKPYPLENWCVNFSIAAVAA